MNMEILTLKVRKESHHLKTAAAVKISLFRHDKNNCVNFYYIEQRLVIEVSILFISSWQGIIRETWENV